MHVYWMLLKPWNLPAHLHFQSMTEAIMKSCSEVKRWYDRLKTAIIEMISGTEG